MRFSRWSLNKRPDDEIADISLLHFDKIDKISSPIFNEFLSGILLATINYCFLARLFRAIWRVYRGNGEFSFPDNSNR